MNALLATLIARPRTILMIMALLVMSGVGTYITIAKESSPNIALPIIQVAVPFEGVSAEDAESLLVKPLEQELKSIDNVKTMLSEAIEGRAGVTVEFHTGVDEDKALTDVREKVNNAKALFPSGVDEPTVKHMTAASLEVIITLILSGEQNYRSLVTQARALETELELMPEILDVELVGDSDEVIDIEIDPAKIQSYQLNLREIASMLQANSAIVPAGSLESEQGDLSFKIPTVFKTPADVLSQPVVVDGDRVLTIADLADVRFTHKKPQSKTWLNGEPSIELRIYKKSGENILDTVAKVKALTAEYSKQWPETTKVTYLHDLSLDINDMIGDLQSSILSSVVLVIIVLVAALGLRSAFLVGVSIPISFLTGILIVSMLGHSVNMVVLFSLIMAVGMLVDGAIVVIELAQRKLSEGKDSTKAYTEAAQQMAWPIIASTGTTLSAFIPLLFWPGFFGEFMKYLPITLIAVLSASLVVALVIIPTIGRLVDKRRQEKAVNDTAIEQVQSGNYQGLSKRYMKVLERLIKHPFKVIVTSFAVLFGIFFAYGQSGLGVEFFPEEDNRVIQVILKDDGSPYSLKEQEAIIYDVYEDVLALDHIQDVQILAGGRNQIGALAVTLEEWQYRPQAKAMVERTRALLKDSPYRIEVLNEGGPQGGKPFQLQFSGLPIVELRKLNKKIQEEMVRDGRFVNIEDNGTAGGVEWHMIYDKSLAAKQGVSVTDIGTSVKLLTNGVYLSAYRPDSADEDIDIRLRLPKEYRHLSQLNHLTVNSPQGAASLSAFVKQEIAPRNSVITRADGEQSMTISADLAEGIQMADILKDYTPKMDAMGIKYEFKGEAADQAESGAFLMKAFIVAIFLMAIILVTQFNSYYQVGLILSAVIFSSGGVLIGLMVQKMAFSIVMSGIGVIALAGIVVNNNIVLIDTFNLLRRQGLEKREAVLTAVYLRLRPVMLTTITTILGLLPLAMGVNIDLIGHSIEVDGPAASVWGVLATAIVWGLSFASIITLLITPCFLSLGRKKV